MAPRCPDVWGEVTYESYAMRNNQGCFIYTSHGSQMVHGKDLGNFEEGYKFRDSQGNRIYCNEVNGVLPREGSECRVPEATALRG